VGARHTLLETAAEQVPHELAQTVIDFCKTVPNVTTAFVGVTAIAEDFQNPYEQLAAGFVLADESAGALQAFGDEFYTRLPQSVQAGGCNVLEPAALETWQARAQRVYSRPASV
jgi:hypothetical protein